MVTINHHLMNEKYINYIENVTYQINSFAHIFNIAPMKIGNSEQSKHCIKSSICC